MSEAMLQEYAKKIADMKKQFLSTKNPKERTQLIKEMRILHGKALAMHNKNIASLKNGDVNEKFLEISLADSLIYLMHHDIRNCETIAFKEMSDKSGSMSLLSSATIADAETEASRAKMPGKKTQAKMDGDKLIIIGMTTDQASEYPGRSDNLLSVVRGELENQSGGNFQGLNASNCPCNGFSLTDEIDNLNTENILKLISEHNQQYGGQNASVSGSNFNVEKPTVVLFKANWCPYCKKLEPEWIKFKQMANGKIQVLELDVGRDAELAGLAKEGGAMGYPTIILFKDGEMRKIDGRDANKIAQLVGIKQ